MTFDFNWLKSLRHSITFSEQSIAFTREQIEHWETELEKLKKLLDNQNHWLEKAEKREAEKGTNNDNV